MSPDLERAEALARQMACDGGTDLVIDVDPPEPDHTLVGIYDATTDRQVIATVPHDARRPIELQYGALKGPVKARDDQEAAQAILRLLRAPVRPRGFLRQLLDG